jgi:acetaldehyde dehydrogenase
MPLNVAVIGSGNIGSDLMFKILRNPKLKMIALVGIDPNSDGLARARKHDIAAIDTGIEGLLARKDLMDQIDLIFDATSAKAHEYNAPLIAKAGKFAVDLTPAAVGPYIIPPLNLQEHLEGDVTNVNMVTCGGQATIPIVGAISRVQAVEYGEIVATIASKSAGPGTRANIDEFTETTSKAIEAVGGAAKGKAIIVLNPAEPPLMMRDTVYTLSEFADEDEIAKSVERMASEVQAYVPGYRLKQKVQFDRIEADRPIRIPGVGARMHGLKTSIFLEVEGAAHYLPAYAGNLDIMTSAAMRTAEAMAARMLAAVVA